MSDLATRTLLRALTGTNPGAEITADTVRAEFDMAQLTSAQRGAAFKSAARLGYLRGTDRVVRSQVESRKNGANRVWIRTRKAIPAHSVRGGVMCANVAGAQGDLCDNWGSKTAPGVASTNTESLAHSEAAKPHGRTCIT